MCDPSEQIQQSLRRLLATIPAIPTDAALSPIPAECPFNKRLPKRRDYKIRDAIRYGAISCCRVLQPFWINRSDVPLCRLNADEVYRFFYMQAFGRHAVITISKRRDEIEVERRYHAGMFNQGEAFKMLLADADWQRLQDALSAVDFWSLPREVDSAACLDGFEMTVEGRRGDEFRATHVWNPNVEALWRLCRLAFDLGGLADISL